ncbi:phage tail protein [Breoghania sp.]|uniref:phage tail protein n=1 Tax=Breoghania sp. TaxID=2065378 RepID=UPI002AA82D6F|nr:phage tail protein [Breoghania sp.]
MSQPLLALGPHIFTIAPLNFQSIERETEACWPSIPRFGTAPGRQFTGFGEDPITISGLLFPEEMGGRDAYESVRATQAAAQPVLMVGWATASAARVFGRVVILRISDTQSIISREGQGRRVEYEIEVAPYLDNGRLGLFY